jgi:glycosyltransferase involved in cell wall biosynthesis
VRNHPPLVSVVIPTYSQSTMLIEAVESALSQTYRSSEIFIIPDRSTDDTAARIAPYADRGDAQYIYQPNRRRAAARNTGIEASRGELIPSLDYDDVWHPIKLEKQVGPVRGESVGPLYCGARANRPRGQAALEAGPEKHCRVRIFDSLLFDHFLTNSSLVTRRSCVV